MDPQELLDSQEPPKPIFEFIYNYVDKDDFKKYFRLIVIVCVYIFARSWYTNFAKTREIRKKLEEDNLLQLKRENNEIEPKDQSYEELELGAQSFGWGKTTRRNVKRQEQILEEKLLELTQAQQTAYNAAEDHDIDDLLE